MFNLPVQLLLYQLLGEKMLHDIWARSVSILSPLLVEALIWLGGGGLKVGLYWTFCLRGEPWVGSLWENRDLTVAKSNQMFWGLTGPISQCWLLLTSWVQFRRKASGFRLSQTRKQKNVSEKLQDPSFQQDIFLVRASIVCKLFHHSYSKHRHDLFHIASCEHVTALGFSCSRFLLYF